MGACAGKGSFYLMDKRKARGASLSRRSSLESQDKLKDRANQLRAEYALLHALN